ncbi:MAG TPA: hypothetical protein ENK46_09780 [Flavobacteriia bacterium]|nr:hypothetical protein [Flavobacteriia bacterium]
MADSAKTKFSTNVLAVTGFITAIAGLITVLHQTGVISFSKKQPPAKVEKVIEKQMPNEEVTTITVSQPNKSNKSGQEETVANNSYQKNETQITYNLTGYWYDTLHAGRYYFNHQASGSVSFQEYSLLNGIWIVTAEGSGTVYKNEIKVPYYTLYGLLGTFTGTIKEDGLTIKGTALDNASGIKTPLLLQKE